MDSPSFGIIVQYGSRFFRVHPSNDCYGVASVQTAVVRDQSIAPFSPSPLSPREIIGPLRMSIGTLNE